MIKLFLNKYKKNIKIKINIYTVQIKKINKNKKR